MEIYKGVLGVVALIVLVLIALAIVVLAISKVIDSLERRRQALYQREYERALVELGRKLRYCADYFGEDPASETALRILASRLMFGRGVDPSEYRSEWRRELKEQSK